MPGSSSPDLPAGAKFDDLPGAAAKPKNYGDWQKAFVNWLSTSQALTTYRSPSLGVTSNGSESEGDFRARLMQKAREKRDEDVAALRQKIRAEAGGAAGASPPLAAVSRKGEGAGVVAMGSERPADRRDSPGRVPWPKDDERHQHQQGVDRRARHGPGLRAVQRRRACGRDQLQHPGTDRRIEHGSAVGDRRSRCRRTTRRPRSWTRSRSNRSALASRSSWWR